MESLLYKSITELGKSIRNKEVSSQEVLDSYLKRIADVNPKLNAVVQISEETARLSAKKADEELTKGKIPGPLHGIPMTIKDSFDTKGIISTGGTKGREHFVPSEDATVVDRLRKAGAILIGKTNTSELTLTYETDNLIYGKTNNPYNTKHSSGGSSGGAASIVAAGGSAFDIGTDYGGSLRYPSHCCGVTTIKPTTGVVPRTGHILPFGGHLDSFQQVGPIAKYVEDLNLLLNIISGPDWIDPSIVPISPGNYKNIDLKNLRVAFHTDNKIIKPTTDTENVIKQAAKLLEDAGAIVEEALPEGIDQTYELMIELLSADGGTSIRRLLKQAGTSEHTLPWLGLAPPVEAEKFDAIIMKWYHFRSTMLSFFKDYDVILCPVNAYPAKEHGTTGNSLEAFSYSMTYNMTGWPSAVVRGGESSEQLPIGIQIVTQPFREDVALAVAEFFESNLGGYKPPLI